MSHAPRSYILGVSDVVLVWAEPSGTIPFMTEETMRQLRELGAHLRSRREPILLALRKAAALKAGSSVLNGRRAERMQMAQPASARQFVRRLMLDAKKAMAVKALRSRAAK